MTKYKILCRERDGKLKDVGEYETNGPEQAMRRALTRQEGQTTADVTLGMSETLVAVPVGNWTEQGAREKVQRTIELFDPADMVEGAVEEQHDPNEDGA